MCVNVINIVSYIYNTTITLQSISSTVYQINVMYKYEPCNFVSLSTTIVRDAAQLYLTSLPSCFVYKFRSGYKRLEANYTWFSTCQAWMMSRMQLRQTKLESSPEALRPLLPPSSSSSDTFNIVAVVAFPLNRSPSSEFSWLLLRPFALFRVFLFCDLPDLFLPQHNAILYNFPVRK